MIPVVTRKMTYCIADEYRVVFPVRPAMLKTD
jgi:hypothetical protein